VSISCCDIAILKKLLVTPYLKRDEGSVFFGFQSELSAQKYGTEFNLCKRECLSDETAKNTGAECKRTPDPLTSNLK